MTMEGYQQEVYEYEKSVCALGRCFVNIFTINNLRFKIEGRFDSYQPQSHATLYIYDTATRQYNRLEALFASRLKELYGDI